MLALKPGSASICKPCAIEQAEVMYLSPADQNCFAQALLAPPEAAPALKRAFARRRKLLVFRSVFAGRKSDRLPRL
jgi:hypothetical protein